MKNIIKRVIAFISVMAILGTFNMPVFANSAQNISSQQPSAVTANEIIYGIASTAPMYGYSGSFNALKSYRVMSVNYQASGWADLTIIDPNGKEICHRQVAPMPLDSHIWIAPNVTPGTYRFSLTFSDDAIGHDFTFIVLGTP